MRKAFIFMGPKDPYPGSSVALGLQRLGYKTSFTSENLNEVTALITWTLWRDSRRSGFADFFSKRNIPIFCMENGWLPDIAGRKYFQLARRLGQGSGINGQGSWPIGDNSRWNSWGIHIKPWRISGEALLVCPQRGVTPKDPLISHGQEWADDVFMRLRSFSDRPIWWRPHSGSARLCVPKTGTPDRIILAKDEDIQETLKNVHCTVVYSTSVSNISLINGVPVLFEGPRLFAEKLCGRVTKEEVEHPPMPNNRTPTFGAMAWAQWNEEELASGEPFKRLGL